MSLLISKKKALHYLSPSRNFFSKRSFASALFCATSSVQGKIRPQQPSLKVQFPENTIDDHKIKSSELEEIKEYRLKVIVVGALYTGKTSIIKRYVNNYFSKTYKSTIGVDFAVKVVNVDNKRVHLQLWDIAGQERFGSMTSVYYKKAAGALIVFDVNDIKSFQAVETWAHDIREKLKPSNDKIPILLIGNKIDIRDKPFLITKEQIEEAVKNFGFLGWQYTSAKDNTNIAESICFLLDAILKNYVDEPKNESNITGADLALKNNNNNSGEGRMDNTVCGGCGGGD